MDISSTKENGLIKKERLNCGFSVLELTNLLDGGKQQTKLRHEIGKC